MKKNFFLTVLSVIAALSFLSCSKDNSAVKPTVTLTEVGHENSKLAVPGDDMHLEADILAENLIARIDVELHQEDGTYKIEKSYTDGKYIGVKNTEFHEHIDIPADAPLGEYHLHFTVADKKGQTVTVEEHVNFVAVDPDHNHEEE